MKYLLLVPVAAVAAYKWWPRRVTPPASDRPDVMFVVHTTHPTVFDQFYNDGEDGE